MIFGGLWEDKSDAYPFSYFVGESCRKGFFDRVRQLKHGICGQAPARFWGPLPHEHGAIRSAHGRWGLRFFAQVLRLGPLKMGSALRLDHAPFAGNTVLTGGPQFDRRL
jgi:hypothetical protein